MPPKQELNLLAALIATNGGKADCNAIAAILDTTYDTIENRLRKIKREGQALLAEASAAGRCDENGKPQISTKASSSSKASTPRGQKTPAGAKGRGSKAAASGSNKRKNPAADSDEADAGASETPSKRRRGVKKEEDPDCDEAVNASDDYEGMADETQAQG